MAKYLPPPSWLVEVSKRAKAGETVFVTVRELVANFDRERRGSNTVFTIRRALSRLEMTTTPKFYSVNLDALVQLVPKKNGGASDEDEREDARQPIVTFGMLKCVESQRAIRSRPRTANGQAYPRWIVRPGDSLNEAAVLLASDNTDFVPVGDDETKISGVLSWDDIAMQDILSRSREKVTCAKACKPPVFVRETDSVYDKKHEISKHGHVLVLDDGGRCFAIVRASDLTIELLRLTENFLLLQEIENLLRLMVEMTEATLEEINGWVEERRRGSIQSPDQLMFSEYAGILMKQPVLQRLEEGYGIPKHMVKRIAVDLVENVRKIRNKVVHFHPDENNELAKQELAACRDFIRNLIETATNQ